MENKRKIRHVGLSALLGFLAAFPIMAAVGFIYLRFGHPPVATADPPFPYEETIVHIPLDARINRHLALPPFSATPDNLIAGARIYAAHCAVCHGTPNHDSDFAKWEYPTAPQLWNKGADGTVGVSNDQPGVSYWKVNNGIRLTGMPSFKHILTQPEMWQVSLLIKQADQPQSSAVIAVLDKADSLRAKAASEEMATHTSAEAQSRQHAAYLCLKELSQAEQL